MEVTYAVAKYEVLHTRSTHGAHSTHRKDGTDCGALLVRRDIEARSVEL